MKYPIGIQNFEDLREKGFVYVDKTESVHQIATRGKYYFLSRPRRFGKSLLLSTLRAYFEGKRQLFKGLAMEKLESEWAEYPVLYLDLNNGQYKLQDSLMERLTKTLDNWAEQYGIDKSDESPNIRFEDTIRHIYKTTGKQVVILIDEYDKPMLQTFDNVELQNQHRGMLKAFYSVLKSEDQHIRFAFLTGVTKFGKVSVFSDLNNLSDISFDSRYAGICGITETELHQYFEVGIKQLAGAIEKTVEETCEILRKQYDGYHFYPNTEGVYNPFSLLNTLESLQIRDYWFETGTPTFLVDLLRQSDYDLRELQQKPVSVKVLNSVEELARNPIAMLYQTGYLTIKDYDKEFGLYLLDFPNQEVDFGFTSFIMPYYTPPKDDDSMVFVREFVRDVRSGQPEQFLQRLQNFFDDADYRVAGKMEKYFQNAMYIIFRLMGFFTEVERATSRGRIDLTIQTKDYVYIMEIKLDGTPREALQQIEEKGYARPFSLDKRKIYKIGVGFSSETRGISEWLVEQEPS